MKNNFLYQPYYCEENIWQLAKQMNEEDGEVWFIINPNQTIATAQQRATEPDRLIIWDYHVVYYSLQHGIFDLDSRCQLPCPADEYIKVSFIDIAHLVTAEYTPHFRIISAREYISLFSSNREHMLDKNNEYHQSPPDWSPIGDEHNLPAFIDYHQQQFGKIYSLNELIHLLKKEL